MCEFLSAIVLPSGEIVCDPEHTDSHEDLVDIAGVKDLFGNLVRVELVPASANLAGDLSSYTFKVDEDGRDLPDWFTLEMRDRVEDNLRDRIRRMIISEPRKTLVGGCHILVEGAFVWRAVRSRIYLMDGGASLRYAQECRIYRMRDHTRITEASSTAVTAMLNHATISSLHGFSVVETMYDNAVINRMYDRSQVGGMFQQAQVDAILDRGSIGNMYDKSRLVEAGPYGTVGRIFDEASAPRHEVHSAV